ncbi:hypothetical protein B0H16DRAFT_1480628 [Mycena metata]|uniref:Uncharacterized protein n=1 Tax=Mycena metata TaxID=1033252 RepID=A0AAD7H321_9AGAR|nr:hypothetical protein B0H16DRAFT_1480628 [Mycena metata]
MALFFSKRKARRARRKHRARQGGGGLGALALNPIGDPISGTPCSKHLPSAVAPPLNPVLPLDYHNLDALNVYVERDLHPNSMPEHITRITYCAFSMISEPLSTFSFFDDNEPMLPDDEPTVVPVQNNFEGLPESFYVDRPRWFNSDGYVSMDYRDPPWVSAAAATVFEPQVRQHFDAVRNFGACFRVIAAQTKLSANTLFGIPLRLRCTSLFGRLVDASKQSAYLIPRRREQAISLLNMAPKAPKASKETKIKFRFINGDKFDMTATPSLRVFVRPPRRREQAIGLLNMAPKAPKASKETKIKFRFINGDKFSATNLNEIGTKNKCPNAKALKKKNSGVHPVIAGPRDRRIPKHGALRHLVCFLRNSFTIAWNSWASRRGFKRASWKNIVIFYRRKGGGPSSSPPSSPLSLTPPPSSPPPPPPVAAPSVHNGDVHLPSLSPVEPTASSTESPLMGIFKSLAISSEERERTVETAKAREEADAREEAKTKARETREEAEAEGGPQYIATFLFLNSFTKSGVMHSQCSRESVPIIKCARATEGEGP